MSIERKVARFDVALVGAWASVCAWPAFLGAALPLAAALTVSSAAWFVYSVKSPWLIVLMILPGCTLACAAVASRKFWQPGWPWFVFSVPGLMVALVQSRPFLGYFDEVAARDAARAAGRGVDSLGPEQALMFQLGALSLMMLAAAAGWVTLWLSLQWVRHRHLARQNTSPCPECAQVSPVVQSPSQR